MLGIGELMKEKTKTLLKRGSNRLTLFFNFFITVPLPKCATVASRYGCCWDNKTEAKSHAGEGCPGKKK